MNDMKAVFEALNDELAKENLNLIIICVGGYALERYDLRATQDIDAFYEENAKINEIIERVGRQFNINTPEELWLNNSVANMNKKPPIDICEKIYSFDNLNVLVAPLEYVLGMKIESARGQDLKDIGTIIKYEQYKSPFNVFDRLKEMGFDNIDFSMLLEGFSNAYGMDWLEEFFKNNQEKISSYY